MTVITWYCDRCGKEVPEWTNTRGFHISTNNDERLDICQDCYNAFKEWWEKGKETTNETPL